MRLSAYKDVVDISVAVASSAYPFTSILQNDCERRELGPRIRAPENVEQ